MAKKVTVYTADDCMRCKMTKKHLDDHGKDFEVVNVSHDDEARDYVKNVLGYKSAPVVVIPVELAPGLARELEKENSQEDRPPYLRLIDGSYVFGGFRPNYLNAIK